MREMIWIRTDSKKINKLLEQKIKKNPFIGTKNSNDWFHVPEDWIFQLDKNEVKK